MRLNTLTIFFLFLVSLVSAAPITIGNDSQLDTVFSYDITSGSSPYTTRFSTQNLFYSVKEEIATEAEKREEANGTAFAMDLVIY